MNKKDKKNLIKAIDEFKRLIFNTKFEAEEAYIEFHQTIAEVMVQESLHRMSVCLNKELEIEEAKNAERRIEQKREYDEFLSIIKPSFKDK